MWSGYINKLSDVKQLVDYAGDNLIRSHVSGHVTKEDLERAIDIVRPDKLIIHHSSDSNNNLYLLNNTILLTIQDNQEVIL